MNKDYDLEERAQFFFIALSMLISRDPRGIIPETINFLEPDQLLLFIKMYGGRSIYIPSSDEFSKDLYAALAAYYRYTKEFTWSKIQDLLEVDGNNMRSIKTRVENWKKYLEDQNLDITEYLRETRS